MLSFFATLGIGMRSLQAQRQGIEVTGQNLANVNNPGYARQRLLVQSSVALPTEIGPQGTGADAVSIQQIRSSLVDRQITSESSVNAFLEAQQRALQYAESSLGEQIDRNAASVSGTSATNSGGSGLSTSLNEFFNAFQSLSASPSSITERQSVITKGQTLASRFSQTDERLQELGRGLNESLGEDLVNANNLLKSIADLNDQIVGSEFAGGVANDLRDLRQQRLEELAKIVNIESVQQANGAVNVSISGTQVVQDKNVADTLELYDAGNGQMLVRAATSDTPLTLTGGSVQGTIDARDGALASLRTQINDLAKQVISEVNAVHRAGFGLNNSTGEDFFSGTDASDIKVNARLTNDPTLIQASGAVDAPGDNTVALALAQLAMKRHASLGNHTFSERHGQTVAELGLALSTNNNRLTDQQLVQNMLTRQRDSVSGVSIDEEMTELVKFQKAFEASARLVSTIDEMLDTVVNLKR
ncbi:MAG: flagellar hook-associated protein FlgK [Verrucomicrobia bacterium]|nr:flagellar hook-associated protein FlgK [Verrucomicrobiota bacterium]